MATDLQDEGLQAYVQIDREAAGRFGVSVAAIDARAVQRVRPAAHLHHLHAVEPVPRRAGSRARARAARGRSQALYVPGSTVGATGTATTVQVPLTSVAQIVERPAPLAINHVAQFPSATIVVQPRARRVARRARWTRSGPREAQSDMPLSVETSFQGAAEAFRASLTSTLFLLLAAVVTMYIVLGVLYESYIHPVTILLDAAFGGSSVRCWRCWWPGSTSTSSASSASCC